MRRLVTGALAALAATGAMLLSAPSASANDIGDGSLACSRGEICFIEVYFSGYGVDGSDVWSGLKHFWNSDMDHSNNAFHNGARLLDNIQGYLNRDTQCTVSMWDVTSTGAWFSYKLLYRGGSATYLDMGTADYSDTSNYNARDRNNGHSRC